MKKEAVSSFMAVVPEGVHSPPPPPLSFISVCKRDVPELPDWNVIRKQHNRFMTLHHVCPSLLFRLHPSREIFVLGIHFRKRFISTEG